MNKAPIFVVGQARSGTTLLSALLGRHPRIAVSPETHFFLRHARTRAELSRHVSVKNAMELVRDGYGLSDLTVNPNDFRTLYVPSKQRAQELFDLSMRLFLLRQGKERWCEKTPGHILKIPIIRSKYPEARIVNLVRDPRAVINSLEGVPWSVDSIILNAFQWWRCIRAAERHQEGGLISLRYEDLATRPRAVLVAVCTFLEEDFAPEMLEGSDVDGLVPGWEKAWKEKVFEGVDHSRAEAWRNELSQPRQDLLQILLGRVMRRWGYGGEFVLPGPRMAALIVIDTLRLARYLAVSRKKFRHTKRESAA